MANHKVEIITPERPEEWLRELADAYREYIFFQPWSQQQYTIDSIRCISRSVLMPAHHQRDLIDMFSEGAIHNTVERMS